mmetsp:Transcript_10120/g.17818  ORF Transcript_10120/g.17818 Transcript_10120/m.17818 type:complete len:472 (-) Transcript_10120:48-1463(-)
MATVLVLGGGGREHALAWKLSQSGSVAKVLVAPGNAGTDQESQGKVQNAALDVADNAAVVDFCKNQNVELVCVGPEVPLVNGVADALAKANILCFGPSKQAALLEGSKAFSKDFMVRNNIPTAVHKSFTKFDQAVQYIKSLEADHKVVVKASGLAAGKGVILPDTAEEAIQALKEIMVEKAFGEEAGKEVVVEDLLVGPEVSVFAFSDGSKVHLLPPLQDHKRIFDNDLGPNTGGMGAYCPATILTPELTEFVQREVVQRSVDAAKAEGFPFIGLLYCGLMLTPQGPKLLEYNCRFGDPETQVAMMVLESDLYHIMRACASGDLAKAGEIFCYKDMAAATVVAASEGYPGSYPKGKVITGIEDANNVEGVKVFHAGTKVSDSKLVTSGGRVLAVSARGEDLSTALDKAYEGMSKISFEGMQFRKDIGQKGLHRPGLATLFVQTHKQQLLLLGAAAAALTLAVVAARLAQRD